MTDTLDEAAGPPAIAVTGTRHRQGVDERAAAEAVRRLLIALGGDLTDPEFADTPRRVAAAFAELLTPESFTMTTFANDAGCHELVLVRDIPVRSVCAHHLLPFVGRAHVGYLPEHRLVGISKLARTVATFANDLQTQERLTVQIAQELHSALGARGVGVIIESDHTCMTLRGVRAHGASTLTRALCGALARDPVLRAEFLAAAHT